MAARGKLPGWIRRRTSDRPVARWINWDARRPPEPQTAKPELPSATELDPDSNVVRLFRRTG